MADDAHPPSSDNQSPKHRALCDAVDVAFEAQQVPWLTSLVDEPSHTKAKANVEKAAAIVDAKVASLGLRQERIADPTGTYADHRIYSCPGTSDDDTALALVGHVDTVFPATLGFLKFKRDPESSDNGGDVIRGPGVLDMKSGLSEIIFALQAVKSVDPQAFDKLKVRFVLNSDEEVGSPSSFPIFERLAPTTSMAMVFEAGRHEDTIVTRRKGGGSFRLIATGRAAHSGNEHPKGVNAIHALALVIPRIEALTDYERGNTVNVGLIEGGTAKNTVPEEASCVIDTRFITREGADSLVGSLEAIAADPFAGVEISPERLGETKFRLEGRVTRPPMEATPKSQIVRIEYERFAADQGIRIGEAPLQGGGSDANLLASHGVPSIDGLGPYGKSFHSVDEWSSLSSLRLRTRALACFLVDGIERVEASWKAQA